MLPTILKHVIVVRKYMYFNQLVKTL